MAKPTLIYQPTGPAGEYAKWAVNLHNGCTHGCTYCYNRRGVFSHAFGEKPSVAAPVRKCAENLYSRRVKNGIAHPEENAVEIKNEFQMRGVRHIIKRDVAKISPERLREDGGVFFSFKCDPLEFENHQHTAEAFEELALQGIPVTILTKSTDWMQTEQWQHYFTYRPFNDLLTIGFTLTGMDAMEVNAPSTSERVAALERISKMGVKTFVSLEPVIDMNAARTVVATCCDYTKEFRIGLQSPYKKDRYDITELKAFINAVTEMQITHRFEVIWKDSIFNTLDRHGVQYKRYSRPKGCVLSHLE